MSTLSERFNIAFQSKGGTKTALAEAVNVSSAAVTLWFTGASATIESGNLFRAAKFLSVDPMWLATGQGEMTPTAAGRVEYVQVAQKMSLHQILEGLSELLASADHPTRKIAALLLGELANNPDTLPSVSKGLAAVLDDCDCVPTANRKAA